MGSRRESAKGKRVWYWTSFFFFFFNLFFFFFLKPFLPVMSARPGIRQLCTEAVKTTDEMLTGVEAAKWPPAFAHACPLCPDTRHRPRDEANRSALGFYLEWTTPRLTLLISSTVTGRNNLCKQMWNTLHFKAQMPAGQAQTRGLDWSCRRHHHRLVVVAVAALDLSLICFNFILKCAASVVSFPPWPPGINLVGRHEKLISRLSVNLMRLY